MKDCRTIRKTVSQTLPLPAELKEHLFACFACRRFVRAGQILRLMHEFRQGPASGSPEFVERVMSGLVRREEHQPKRFGLGNHAIGRCADVFNGCRLRFFRFGGWAQRA
jgi:hypothetical protein